MCNSGLDAQTAHCRHCLRPPEKQPKQGPHLKPEKHRSWTESRVLLVRRGCQGIQHTAVAMGNNAPAVALTVANCLPRAHHAQHSAVPMLHSAKHCPGHNTSCHTQHTAGAMPHINGLLKGLDDACFTRAMAGCFHQGNSGLLCTGTMAGHCAPAQWLGVVHPAKAGQQLGTVHQGSGLVL